MKQEYIENKEKQIRRLDRKTLPVFVAFILVCTAIGYFIGMLIGNAGDVSNFTGRLGRIMAYVCPILLAAMNIVCAFVCIPALNRLTKKAKEWDGEDEDYIEDVEDRISQVVGITNMVWVAGCCLFGTGCYLLKDVEKGALLNVVLIAFFFLGMAAVVYMQHGALKAEQLINPEKQGSLFALDFNREQEKNFDEAEKLTLYKAAYKANKAVNMACMLCWLFALISQLLFNCGVLPVVFVSVIWFTSVAVMSTELRKLEKNGGK